MSSSLSFLIFFQLCQSIRWRVTPSPFRKAKSVHFVILIANKRGCLFFSCKRIQVLEGMLAISGSPKVTELWSAEPLLGAQLDVQHHVGVLFLLVPWPLHPSDSSWVACGGEVDPVLHDVLAQDCFLGGEIVLNVSAL